PMKIIGRAAELDPEKIAATVFQRLHAVQLPADWREALEFAARKNGAWISYTFWITLPHEHAEKPLREAIQRLPGVVMQL
ncbi:MAG TPA: hypothetical protein VN436_08160, partial [Holophaga sp.]|nr:hypothetical protein [Holophaga sp.]